MSIVEICNLALGRAGITDSIMNLDTEQSVPALWCKANFAAARDALLRDFPWRFATKTVNLARLSEERADGQVPFLYPTDCLNILRVGNHLPFTVEVTGDGHNMRKVVVCSAQHVSTQYIARVTDPNLFDSLFISALAWFMAGELALSVGGNNSQRAQMAYQQYEMAKVRAQRASVAESCQECFVNTEFLIARA